MSAYGLSKGRGHYLNKTNERDNVVKDFTTTKLQVKNSRALKFVKAWSSMDHKTSALKAIARF